VLFVEHPTKKAKGLKCTYYKIIRKNKRMTPEDV